MKIWLPNTLYQVFPMLSVLTGFFLVALIHTPFAVIVSALLYTYAFRVLWLRS